MGYDHYRPKSRCRRREPVKRALADINQSFKVLGSEMKLVTSEFYKNDRSIAALTVRNDVLNKQIDEQKNKITALEQALANAAESFGENDRRTQAWVVQLNNAKAELKSMEREFQQSTGEADKREEGLDDSGKSADEAGGRFGSSVVFSKASVRQYDRGRFYVLWSYLSRRSELADRFLVLITKQSRHFPASRSE